MKTFNDIESAISQQLMRLNSRITPIDRASLATLRRNWEKCTAEQREEWLTNVDETASLLNDSTNLSEAEVLKAISYLMTYPMSKERVLDIEGLMVLGDRLWHAIEWTDDDEELVNRVASVMQLPTDDTFRLRYAWLYRWTDIGFPTIKISAPYAASAMTTVAQDDVLSDLEPPWRAFLIEMPKEPVLYLIDERANKPIQASRLAVLCEDPKLVPPWTDHAGPPVSNFKNAWSFTVEPASIGLSLLERRMPTVRVGKPKGYCMCCKRNDSVVQAHDDLVLEWPEISPTPKIHLPEPSVKNKK
jgi:hypothetical protein